MQRTLAAVIAVLALSHTAQAQQALPASLQPVVSEDLETPVPIGGGPYAYDYAYGEGYGYGQLDLFYNYYVPSSVGGPPAQMYVAPLPVPPHVGHTYYTYEPLMPHEFLYRHRRKYTRFYNDGCGKNTTRVIWH